MLLTVACNKDDGAPKPAASGSAAPATAAGSKCPAGTTEGTGAGFCIKLPDGYKFEKVEGDTVSFVNSKFDRIRIEHEKDYKFDNTPDDFKSMTSNKPPTKSGVLLGGKGGWALLDDGKVALGSVRINHPKGGMLTWSLSSDSKSGKVQSDLETVKTITLL
jgi:hypothetical protein